MPIENEGVTKPAMVRIARRAGIKSVADECFPLIRDIIHDKVDEIIRTAVVINSEHHTKTLMSDDIYEALRIRGYNIPKSTELGVSK